jgi:hypothetical protein
MGQTTSGGKEPVRGTSVAAEFQSLQQLVGDWIIDEQVFLTPNAEPIMNTGRMTCRSTLGGLAMVVITEIATTAERTVQLVTFNPKSDRYEQTLINSLSDVGIVNMTGRELDTRSAEDIRIQFGKAATLVWEWTLENNQHFAGEPGLFIPDRIVENRINADLWVLQFFGRTAQAQHGQQAEFLIRQQVVTRASVGCAPQVGCELGCAGLVDCVEGCEGFQGPTTRTALGCSCQSPAMGQQQFVTQPQVLAQSLLPQQLVAQQQLLTQQQLIAQQQLVSAMPLVGLVQAVAVAPQGCKRQVLRPVPLARTGHGK